MTYKAVKHIALFASLNEKFHLMMEHMLNLVASINAICNRNTAVYCKSGSGNDVMMAKHAGVSECVCIYKILLLLWYSRAGQGICNASS